MIRCPNCGEIIPPGCVHTAMLHGVCSESPTVIRWTEAKPFPEAEIIINGHVLTVGESMTVRVALSDLSHWLSGNDLGGDEHGRAMRDGYNRNINNIFKMMDLRVSHGST